MQNDKIEATNVAQTYLKGTDFQLYSTDLKHVRENSVKL
jgi:hypothetical protein